MEPKDFAIVPVENASPATPTAPTLKGAAAYFRHRVMNDKVFTRVEKREEGQEFIVELTDKDRETWPELAGIERISFWEKMIGEPPLMLTVAMIPG